MKKIIRRDAAALVAAMITAAMVMGCSNSGSNSAAQTEAAQETEAQGADAEQAGNTEQNGDEAQEVQTVERLSIAFSPYADAEEITTATEPLEELLRQVLLEKGYDVQEIDMTVGTSYTAVGEALSAGSADLGFISGGNYVLFSDDCDVLLTALRYGLNKDSENAADWNDGSEDAFTDNMVTYYRSVIIAGPSEKGQALAEKVAAGEELTWDDLNDANWAVLTPTSASGYIYPALWLQSNYGKSISDLAHVAEADSHTTAISRLASGQADIAVSYAHIRVRNASAWEADFGGEGSIFEDTAIIGVTEPIYNDMIAYSKTSDTMADENFRTAVGEAFIEIAESDEGKEIFSVFSQIGYEWGDDANYDGERDAQELLRSLQ